MFKYLNIIKIFFESPSKEFTTREIARKAKVATATASKILKELKKKGMLKSRKMKNMVLYRANLESDLYRDAKIFYNIRKIKESGLLEKINQVYLKPTVVFFGSAANGLDVENSDFDLLIISEVKKEIELSKFERKINRKIQLFVTEDIHKIKNKNLINSILNGIVIQGEIKWI